MYFYALMMLMKFLTLYVLSFFNEKYTNFLILYDNFLNLYIFQMINNILIAIHY